MDNTSAQNLDRNRSDGRSMKCHVSKKKRQSSKKALEKSKTLKENTPPPLHCDNVAKDSNVGHLKSDGNLNSAPFKKRFGSFNVNAEGNRSKHKSFMFSQSQRTMNDGRSFASSERSNIIDSQVGNVPIVQDTVPTTSYQVANTTVDNHQRSNVDQQTPWQQQRLASTYAASFGHFQRQDSALSTFHHNSTTSFHTSMPLSMQLQLPVPMIPPLANIGVQYMNGHREHVNMVERAENVTSGEKQRH